MPKLNPLTPVLYSTASTRDLSGKIAPPYDVLDEGPKQALLAQDAHNIVAIDLPVTPPKTVGPDEAYDAAGQTYRQWLSSGVLERDDRPAVVAYEQVYDLGGRTVHRRGIFAVLGVEEFNRPGGGIFRHEMTLAGGIGDRTKLMTATSAQLSPIFGIFSDAQAQVAGLLADAFDGREPDFLGVTGNDGVAHRCWRVSDSRTLAALAAFFEKTDVFIADGHHRYTTALQFSKDHPELPGADGCLFVLVAAEDPGMIVLPTHRIVRGLRHFSMRELARVAEKTPGISVSVTEMSREEIGSLPERLAQSGPHAVGLYCPSDKRIWLATFDEDPLAQTHADRPEVWRTLDVSVVQALLIDRLLKPHFGGEGEGQPLRLNYTADAEELLDLGPGHLGDMALGIVMQATPLDSVMRVSRADDVMPPKSTYFYPKLATGLVINPLD